MSEPSLLRVRAIEVKKLFGLYDHDVQLNSTERVTIVHGPNGVGKTMVLKLVAALFAGRFHELALVPFERFEVALSDGTRLTVEQQKPESARPPMAPKRRASLRLFAKFQGKKGVLESDLEPESERLLDMVERVVPWLARIAHNRWFDGRTGESLTAADVIARYPELVTSSSLRARNLSIEPDWFTPIRSRVVVHLIEAQRLLRFLVEDSSGGSRRVGPSMVPTVRDHAQDLHRQIKDTLARYGTESQSLDQTFPQRLIRAAGHALPLDEIKDRMTALESKRSKLKRIGLLDENAAYPFDITSLDPA